MSHWLPNLLIAADAVDVTEGLTPAGWAIMLVSVGSVVLLAGFCTYRVLSLPPVDMEEIKGPLEIDTGDTDE